MLETPEFMALEVVKFEDIALEIVYSFKMLAQYSKSIVGQLEFYPSSSSVATLPSWIKVMIRK